MPGAMPQLNESESKFFESGGAELAPELETSVTRLPSTVEPDAETAATETQGQEQSQQPKPGQQQEQAEPTQAERDNQGRFVPLQALQEERAEKKQLREELRQYREWQAQLAQRLQQMPQSEQAQVPDPETHPLEYINHVLGNVQSTTAELKEWRQQQETQAQQRTAMQQAASWATGQEQEFVKTQPEYHDAYKFAAQARDNELKAMGYSDNERAQIVRMNTAEIVNNAMQQGRNPAEMVWEYARARGFAPKGKPGLQPGAQQQQVADPQAQAKITAGMEAAGGKLNQGGDAGSSELTAKDLSGITDPDEFEKAWKKVFGKKR